MQLEKIFRKSRKTEPKSIVVCRNITMLTIIFLLIGYTIHLIIDIRDDVPILKTESRTDDSLRFPTVTLEFDYNFTIFCALAYNNSTVTPDCLNYVSQPTFDSSSNKYRGKFVPSLDLKAEGPLHSTGLLSIGLMFLVLDRRYDSSSANMSVIEAVIDYSDDSYDELRRTVKKIDPEFIDSLIVSSVHTLFNRQIYMVSYTQSERHIMKKNSLSVFGIPSPILRVPYITAALESGPLPDGIIGYGIMMIKPQTFVVKVEIEQRSNTVLGAFGLLGGIWSIIAGLYAFLLGGDVISPWGCVQSYCCCFIRSTRSKLDKEFPVVPFQSSKNLPESGSESSSQTEETTELKNRLDALEVFIQEYIVDTGYLDGVKKDECPNRVSAWLSRIKLKKSNSREIQGMSETPTQTGHNSTSSSIPPSQYPPSPHSDSDQLDTHTSDLLVRQDQSQPAQQEHGSQSMSDFDQNPTSVVGTVTDVRSNQSLYTAAAAQLSYTGQER